MSTTLITTVLLVLFVAFCEGCTWKKKQKKKQRIHSTDMINHDINNKRWGQTNVGFTNNNKDE
jgi:hypothetical protein